MNIEMGYHNVYYYCNIVVNTIHYRQEEFLTKLWEFSHAYIEEIPEKYCRESILLLFCRWTVQSVMEEDMEAELMELKEIVKKISNTEKSNFIEKILNHDMHFSFEIERAIKYYCDRNNNFFDWLKDKKYDLLEDAFHDYLFELWISDEYETVVNKIANEMFYILFFNRKFLLDFNHYMSCTHNKKYDREYIPQWVKRAVYYRDKGRCVLCGRDLSGLVDIVGEKQIHYDHMVPLEKGGINDISNMQLLCSNCNLVKGANSTTGNVYQNWYDIISDS